MLATARSLIVVRDVCVILSPKSVNALPLVVDATCTHAVMALSVTR